jgi:hypothetical protein
MAAGTAHTTEPKKPGEAEKPKTAVKRVTRKPKDEGGGETS